MFGGFKNGNSPAEGKIVGDQFLDVRVLDSAYKPFPSFAEWASEVCVPLVRWERFSNVLKQSSTSYGVNSSRMVFLSKLEAAFVVPTRGCVIGPAALTTPDFQVKPGGRIQLRSTNGCVGALIISVERLVRNSTGSQIGFLLLSDIDCSAIPSDAEIWIDQNWITSVYSVTYSESYFSVDE